MRSNQKLKKKLVRQSPVGTVEAIKEALNRRLEEVDESRTTLEEETYEAFDKIKKQTEEMKESLNKELEAKFTGENDRLQSTLNDIQAIFSAKEASSNDDKLLSAIKKSQG